MTKFSGTSLIQRLTMQSHSLPAVRRSHKLMILVCILLILIPCDLAHGQVAEAATVLVATDVLATKVKETIDHAKEAGDYLLARALADLLESIEAWKAANEHLLDKAFEGLDQESRNLFSRTQSVLDSAQMGLRETTEDAQIIAELINLAATKPLRSRETYITRYSPKVLLTSDPESMITVKIRGVNLDIGSLTLELPTANVLGTCSTALECLFTFPASALGNDDGRWQEIITIPIKYTIPARGLRGIGGRRTEVKRNLAFSRLPAVAGSIAVSGKKSVERIFKESYTIVPDNYSARNRRHYQIIPPKSGYKWSLNEPFQFIRLNGDHGSCSGIDMAGSNEFGINTFAHCDARGPFYNRKNGWATCQLTGTIYKVETVIEDIAPQTGVFNWVDDTKIPVDPDATQLEIVITTFDGRRLIFPRDGQDRYFRVNSEKGYILIRPLLPKNIF